MPTLHQSAKTTVARGRRKLSAAGKVIKSEMNNGVKEMKNGVKEAKNGVKAAKTAARRRKQTKVAGVVAGAVAGAAALTAAGVMIVRARRK